MNNSNLGTDLGRLFEVGFNIGMLTYIEQRQLKHNYGNLYRQDLRQVNFPKIVRKLVDDRDIISQQHREIVKKWATFFLQKSFLAGLNFLAEFFTAIGWDKPHQQKRIEIVYYQCCFSDENSLGTYTKGTKLHQDWLSQFASLDVDIAKVDFKKYSDTGEFFKADSLIFFRCQKEVRILAIDYSIFSIKSIRDLADLDNIEVLRNILLSEISYLKSKSVFANLGIDSKNNKFNLSESLSRYYQAFSRSDKETIKMIQAGSYAYSFWNWLASQQQIQLEDLVTFHIIGYSDRNIASLCLNQDDLNLLATCYHVYRHKLVDADIKESRQQVLNIIKRKAARSFSNGKKFIDDLLAISGEGMHSIFHQETLVDFSSYLDPIPVKIANQLGIDPKFNLQQTHAQLIQQTLSKDNDLLYLFLTGNPGIGKTTAITNFLKQDEILANGFLFFYISPRTQVNLDILEKFKQRDNNLLSDDRIITINTNSNLITKNDGKLTVQYSFNQKRDRFSLQTVNFIPHGEKVNFYRNTSKNVKRTTATRLENAGNNKKGVLQKC